MSSQTTSGTRKRYKPGQLITIENCVFRIAENVFGMPDCYVCDLDLYQQKNIVVIVYYIVIYKTICLAITLN